MVEVLNWFGMNWYLKLKLRWNERRMEDGRIEWIEWNESNGSMATWLNEWIQWIRSDPSCMADGSACMDESFD